MAFGRRHDATSSADWITCESKNRVDAQPSYAHSHVPFSWTYTTHSPRLPTPRAPCASFLSRVFRPLENRRASTPPCVTQRTLWPEPACARYVSMKNARNRASMSAMVSPSGGTNALGDLFIHAAKALGSRHLSSRRGSPSRHPKARSRSRSSVVHDTPIACAMIRAVSCARDKSLDTTVATLECAEATRGDAARACSTPQSVSVQSRWP